MFGYAFGFSLMGIGVSTLVLWTLIEKQWLSSDPGHSDTGIVVVSCCAVLVALGAMSAVTEVVIETIRLIGAVL